MPVSMARDVHRTCMLPNGMAVDSLNRDDTLMVYRDIFEDDCYRRGGVVLRDGDVILDVGANTGLFILYLNSVLADARIYAFEPVPATFEALRRNVASHNRLDVEIFNVGLSHRSGEATFTHYPRLSNASTMYPDASDRAAEMGRNYVLGRFRDLPVLPAALLALCPTVLRNAVAERVRRHFLKGEAVTCVLTTLAEFLDGWGIDEVDLLKVDAEQSEQHILEGLAERDWPKIRQVIVEVHGGDEASRLMERLLGRRGFRTVAEPNPTFPSLSLVYGVRG